MNNHTNQIWNLFAFRRSCLYKHGNHSLFLVVVCIRDDLTKLLARVGLAQARLTGKQAEKTR